MSILALTSDTLIGTAATGNLEYNGQFFGTDSNASRAQLQRLVLSTTVASTSGTSIDFTSIPSWVKRITVMFYRVSSTGASNYLIQIGSGSLTTSGYVSCGLAAQGGSSSTAAVTSTAGLLATADFQTGTVTNTGTLNLNLITGSDYVSTALSARNDGNRVSTCTGSISLSGALDRLRITTVNGTDAFDAGSVNILYEG